MANDSLKPSELENELVLDNGGMSKKVIVAGEEGSEIPTVTNFRILSVRKHHDSRNRYNTVAVVEVDRFPELPKEVKSVKRYRRRKVPFTRVHLNEAFALAGFTKTATKAYQVTTVESADALIAAIVAKLNIDVNEVTFVKVSDKVATLTAKPDSLGFIGRVTLTTDAGAVSGDWINAQTEVTGMVVVNQGDTEPYNNALNAGAQYHVAIRVNSNDIERKAKVVLDNEDGLKVDLGEITLPVAKDSFVYVSLVPTDAMKGNLFQIKLTNADASYSSTVAETFVSNPPKINDWVKESVTKTAFILGDDDGLVELEGLKPNGEINFIAVRLTGPDAVANSRLRAQIKMPGNDDQEFYFDEFYSRPGGIIAFSGYIIKEGVDPSAKATVTVQGDPQFPYVEIAQFSILPQ